MKIFTLAAVGVATWWLSNPQRRASLGAAVSGAARKAEAAAGSALRRTGAFPDRERDPFDATHDGTGTTTSSADDAATGMPGSPSGTAPDSPNAAERLRSSGALGAGAGIGAGLPGAADADTRPFESKKATQDGEISPGLGDFSRGA